MTQAEKILEEVYGSHKHRMASYPIMDDEKNAILDCINLALTIPVVSRQFKEVNKTDVEDYDLSTVWVLDPNYDNKQNHILDHIDPNSVKIEFLKRRP